MSLIELTLRRRFVHLPPPPPPCLQLAMQLKHTRSELETARRFPATGLSNEENVRDILEKQGTMAGELARKELEVEALKETLRTCRSRAAQAESGARQMTEQMNLIKTTSEEVAMLEAEEIARLEGELEACTKKLADERKCCVDDKAEYERKLGVLASESEEAKGELLKMKRAHNLAAEKAQRLAAKVESMKGYSQDVANRLHSVQFSGHVRDVLGQAANKAAASKGEGEQASAWRDFKRGSDWSRLVAIGRD